MIIVLDTGMGNIGSILNMLKKIGVEAKRSSLATDIEEAGKLILPGVGSFDSGISHLEDLDLVGSLHRRVSQEGTPILGICLGAQLMTQGSEEGTRKGLGWVDACTVRFAFDALSPKPRIPHMGWNHVTPVKDSPLFAEMYQEPRFYFVHSYHFRCRNEHDVLATARYGYPFAAAFEAGNIFGVQFHPEKSHKFGMRLLRNFAERC